MGSVSAYAAFFLLLAFLGGVSASSIAQKNQSIQLGSTLYPTNDPKSWLAPSGRFAFGFYKEGAGYKVGIWIVGKPDMIITWTANRDDPPATPQVTLNLTTDGRLLLGGKKLIGSMPDGAASAAILNSGHLELYDKDHHVIWTTYDYPTDTILGGQKLSNLSELRSSQSDTNHSTGKFSLQMQGDGNLVLYPFSAYYAEYAYWSTDTYTDPPRYDHYLYLNTSGELAVINKTDSSKDYTLYDNFEPFNGSFIFRATLDSDGIFRLYSHIFYGKGWYNKTILWHQPEDACQVMGFCGFSSFCTFNDIQPICLCVPGTGFIDPRNHFLGCKRNFTEENCGDHKHDSISYKMTDMKNMRWRDTPYNHSSTSEDDCRRFCLKNCNCEVAQFQDSKCYMQNLPVKFVKRDFKNDQVESTAFFKVGFTSNNIKEAPTVPPKSHRSSAFLVPVLLVTIGFVSCSCVALAISGFFFFKFRLVEYERLLELGDLAYNQELSLRPFSYSELKRATNGFKQKLGGGSFGAVYKGTLHKGRKVIAVKRLEKLLTDGEREFHAEMQVIGKIRHKNLVQLLGYCVEDSRRLLVYEYVSNGSLGDILFKPDSRPLEWYERVRIILEVARGIPYLHEACETPVIHCDIKPENILIDEFWTAKISDFGMAKLLMPNQTRTVTVVRGTIGYFAPEWHKNIPISVKADVYSFGIVLLETVCCRRNLKINESNSEEIVLSAWAYKCLIAKELNKLVIGQEVDSKSLEKMIKVGLWCIQEEPALRPSMKSVVMMLEDVTDIAIPPCPTSAAL